MELGLVTYNLAREWDLPTLIENCEQTGFRGVELRTTHPHGVEPSLDGDGRAEVRRRFSESAVQLVGLRTTSEFHSADPEEVSSNNEESDRFAVHAHDHGARGEN